MGSITVLSKDVPAVPGVAYNDVRVLAANTAESQAIPTGGYRVFVKSDVDIWLTFDGTTAAVPSGDTTNGSAPHFNGGWYDLTGSSGISVISASAGFVTFTFVKLG